MDTVSLDPRDMKIKPCSKCETIIYETANTDNEDEMWFAYIEDEEEADCQLV